MATVVANSSPHSDGPVGQAPSNGAVDPRIRAVSRFI